MGEEQFYNTETEDYARQKAIVYANWQKQYGSQEKKLLQQIDNLLKKGDKTSHEELLAIFSEKEKLEQYRYASNPLIEMSVFTEIYKMEAAAGEVHTIFDMKKAGESLSLSELIERVRELRFLMWRMEFAGEEDAGEKILNYIKENQVSPFFLCKAVDIMAENPMNMLCELMELTLDAGMLRHTYWILYAMKKLAPEQENIQEMLTELENITGGNKNE
jgi:uncharacterized protein YhfF